MAKNPCKTAHSWYPVVQPDGTTVDTCKRRGCGVTFLEHTRGFRTNVMPNKRKPRTLKGLSDE